MSPSTAALVFSVGTAGLFFLDRDRDTRTSFALWLPIGWVSIGATRMVSQWLGADIATQSPDQILDGSPLDRVILSGFVVAALMVLVARRERTASLLRANGPILLFFAYCAVSVLWSDYPWVALKRWTKSVGNITMVLVVLTDPDSLAAVKRLFARTGFLLIPLSILLIKYYPDVGRSYDRWTGTAYYNGAASGKNGLGYVCLVFGLPALWRFIEALREQSHRTRQLTVHAIMLAMTVWLLQLANSSTSAGALLLGSMLIILLVRGRRPATVHLLVTAISFVAVSIFVFDAGTYVLAALGRDPTLTGRTDLWEELFRLDTKPWFGFGFESFWLGSRAGYLWDKYQFHPNQAHNGYIETYLNLGWVGTGLLAFLIVSGYRNVVRSYRENPRSGTLRLAFFSAAVIYNLSEAAFKVMHPVWIAFLIAITAVPGHPIENDR